MDTDSAQPSEPQPVKRKRGRPKKHEDNSANKKTTAQKERKARYSAHIEDLREQQELVKGLRSRARTQDELVDIVYLYLQLQIDALRTQQKKDQGKVAADAQARVSELLGYSTSTVSRVMSEWNASRSVTVSDAPANRLPKRTRVPLTKEVLLLVRTFVRERRMAQRRVVAKDVMQLLIQHKILLLNHNNSKDTGAALRSVQRFLRRAGYRRGVGKNAMTIAERERLQTRRIKYLQALADNELSPNPLRLVDTDESYLHQFYQREKESFYDPSDPEFRQPRIRHKGRRWCFIAAIQSDAHVPDGEERKESDKAGLIRKSVWIFSPNKKDSSGDYHKAFNGSNFVNWFKNYLLPSLTRPSLIRLDNAAYHLVLPEDTPTVSKCKKADLQAHCTQYKIAFAPADTCATLKVKLKEYIAENIKPSIVQAAEAQGHKVLFTVPYHSDLQPFELVWAQAKGGVAMEYSADTSLDDVKRRLEHQFDLLVQQPDRVARIYKHVAHLEDSYRIADDMDGLDDAFAGDACDNDGDVQMTDASKTPAAGSVVSGLFGEPALAAAVSTALDQDELSEESEPSDWDSDASELEELDADNVLE